MDSTAPKRKTITKLPTHWPLKGIWRNDIGEYIVLGHPDRKPVISNDGKTWAEIDVKNPEHNRIIAAVERARIMR